jgi:hypothetical protein
MASDGLLRMVDFKCPELDYSRALTDDLGDCVQMRRELPRRRVLLNKQPQRRARILNIFAPLGRFVLDENQPS